MDNLLIKSKPHYTYTLAYPDGIIFYVGKGVGDRIDDHEKEARKGIKSYKCNVIRKIWVNGGQVMKTILAYFETHEEACRYEIALIFFLSGLTNRTGGGDGLSDPTGKIGRKISKANMGRPGRLLSEAERQRLIEINTGKKASPETRRKLSESHKGQKLSEENLRKLIEANRARPHPSPTEEVRKRISDSLKGRPLSEEQRRKRKGRPGRPVTEEMRQYLSEVNKARWAAMTEDEREAHRQKLIKGHEGRTLKRRAAEQRIITTAFQTDSEADVIQGHLFP